MHFKAKICASAFISVVDTKYVIFLMFMWKENNVYFQCNVINNKSRIFFNFNKNYKAGMKV